MNYRKLGKSNLQVSEISLGCMSLDPKIEDYSSLLNKAIDSGINYFDTADFYDKGNNESIIGKSLGSRRKEVILATKVGNVWDKNGKTWHWNPSKKYILHTRITIRKCGYSKTKPENKKVRVFDLELVLRGQKTNTDFRPWV